ncbi:flagellar biosynthesis protein FlgN [Marinobacter salinus]|uniref:Flagellar biosynthesis protein FlgN n=1 Tax=Marinobacter salinus TaxID=1874317 RepID=A0A1D9GJQ6_9GAMM|nr:flagellar protein FlgN [Marinobacter salinus]AOY87867.1 flagellar biosynthesis protein FlgN [Marinobacter salinus]
MAPIDELKHALSQDVQQLQELEDILLKEKTCLASSDIRALDALTAEKNQLLSEIRERAKQKIRTLVAMGYRPDSGEPSRFIRSAGLTELYSLWKEADVKMSVCQTLNHNNGRIMSHLQKRLSRLTDIFRGATAQQKLYGAKGEHTSVSSRTILASA